MSYTETARNGRERTVVVRNGRVTYRDAPRFVLNVLKRPETTMRLHEVASLTHKHKHTLGGYVLILPRSSGDVKVEYCPLTSPSEYAIIDA